MAAAVSAAGVVVVAVAAGVVEAVVSVAAVFPAGAPAAVVSVAAALVVGVLASEAAVALPAAAAFGVVFPVPDVVLEGLLERTGVSAFCVSWADCPASSDPLPPQAARDSIISSASGRPG